MNPKLSIVVPFFNEVDNVLPLYRAISDAVLTMDIIYELVFVDDGSRDRTALVDELVDHQQREIGR